MNQKKIHTLTDFEQQLESLTPIEPSANYFEKAMDIFSKQRARITFNWHYLVTGTLALALALSLGWNQIQYHQLSDRIAVAENMTQQSTAPAIDLMANQNTTTNGADNNNTLHQENNVGANQIYNLGEHYIELKPPLQPNNTLYTGGPDVDVAYLFWYGCYPCFAFEDKVNAWKDTFPGSADIRFRRIPAVWSSLMSTQARAYYAALEFSNAEAIHTTLFNSLYSAKNSYDDEASIAPLFESNAIAYEDFSSAFNSPGTILMSKQAQTLTRELQSLGLTGVPTLIINGKYMVKNISFDEILNVANYLVAQEIQKTK